MMTELHKSCPRCGRRLEGVGSKEPASNGVCPRCAGAGDRQGLSEFASRLARFGLGEVPATLLKAAPELPRGK